MPLFDESDVEKSEYTGWTFNCSMVSTCEPLFNDCEDNYEVREKLIDAKVITDACEDDTESCEMWLYFKSKSTAVNFIGRLNTYLEKKEQLLSEAARY
jgi:hypothetical protein